MINENDLSHQPDTFQQQAPRSFKQRKPFKILAATLFIVLVAITGGYLLGSRNNWSTSLSQPSSTTIPSSSTPVLSKSLAPTIEAVSWKTYIDTKQKYLIKYPSEWSIFPNAVGGVIPGYNGTIITPADKLDPHGETFGENAQAGIVINVVGIDKHPNETLLEYQRRGLPAPNGDPNYYVQTKLNGRDALRHMMTTAEVNTGQPIYLTFPYRDFSEST
jgi:hypothetical protein